jgi:hypothetical protein
MADSIIWESDIEKAVARAQTEKKMILLDFFNDG